MNVPYVKCSQCRTPQLCDGAGSCVEGYIVNRIEVEMQRRLASMPPLEHAGWLRAVLIELLRQHLNDRAEIDLSRAVELANRGSTEDQDLGSITFRYFERGEGDEKRHFIELTRAPEAPAVPLAPSTETPQ